MIHDIVIGIDAGGSKTLALAAGMDGQVLGRAKSGPGNYHAVGFAAASAALTEAVREALREAARAVTGGDLSQVAVALNRPGSLFNVRALCLGAAGVDRPEDGALWAEWARQAFPDAVSLIVNDALVVLAAGGALHCCGMAVIAGTGSIVYGRDDQGRMLRAGGWGYLMGDEGSNYAIGQSALQAVTRAADGRGPQTALLEAILKHWQISSPEGLTGKVYGDVSRHDIARLGRVVEATAETGDAVATEILEAAGRELALAARSVHDRLGLHGPVTCALAGSVLVRGWRTRLAFLRAAEESGLELDPVVLVEEPALGAVRLALEEIGELGLGK